MARPPATATREPDDYGVLLARAYAAFVDELRAAMAEAGHRDLPAAFGYVIRAVAAGPLTLRELADRLGVTSPAELKVVDELAARGYLARRPDPDDARAMRLVLTAHGEAALATARRFHRGYEQRLARRVGAARAAALREVLEGIVADRAADGHAAALRPV